MEYKTRAYDNNLYTRYFIVYNSTYTGKLYIHIKPQIQPVDNYFHELQTRMNFTLRNEPNLHTNQICFNTTRYN